MSVLEHLLDMLVLLRLEEPAVSERDPARLDVALDFEVSKFLFDELLLLFAIYERLTGEGSFCLRNLSERTLQRLTREILGSKTWRHIRHTEH